MLICSGLKCEQADIVEACVLKNGECVALTSYGVSILTVVYKYSKLGVSLYKYNAYFVQVSPN